MDFKQAANETFKFFRGAFSENGSGSASRVLAGAVVIATIFWVTYLVIKNSAMPDLGGPSLFIGSGTSATYGLNQVKSVVGAFRNPGKSGGGDPQ